MRIAGYFYSHLHARMWVTGSPKRATALETLGRSVFFEPPTLRETSNTLFYSGCPRYKLENLFKKQYLISAPR